MRKGEELGGYIFSKAASGEGTPWTQGGAGPEGEGAAETLRPAAGSGELSEPFQAEEQAAELELPDGPAEQPLWPRS